jgi:uncharacterized protein
MRWTWDTAKAAANLDKHGIAFEAAIRVFDDPLALSLLDPFPDGTRWRTVGMVEPMVLFVVHTWPDDDDEAAGRIISARKATAHERRAYEQGD